MRFVRPLLLLLVVLTALAACSGRSGNDAVQIEGPSFSPNRVNIRTLEPGPSPPTPSPSPVPTPSPEPVAAPRGASVTSAAGTQQGQVSSYCWSEQVGAPAKCYSHEQPGQPKDLVVKHGEKVLLRIDAQIPPNEESIRTFQGTRSGFESQRIDPALETELTVNLPEGGWSMDLCATWHNRGQPICWLFELEVVAA